MENHGINRLLYTIKLFRNVNLSPQYQKTRDKHENSISYFQRKTPKVHTNYFNCIQQSIDSMIFHLGMEYVFCSTKGLILSFAVFYPGTDLPGLDIFFSGRFISKIICS
jgi:hypothetical protein